MLRFNESYKIAKKWLKHAYKIYQTQNHAEIIKIAKYFGIQLDENKKYNYEIININFLKPKITIYDKKNNETITSHLACCIDNSINPYDLLECTKVEKKTPDYTFKDIFYTITTIRLQSTLKLSNEHEEAIITKKIDDRYNRNYNDNSIITLEYKGSYLSNPCYFSKKYYLSDNNAYFDKTILKIENICNTSKYILTSLNEIAYGVEDFSPSLNTSFKGVCLTNKNILNSLDIKEKTVADILISNNINPKDTSSLIILSINHNSENINIYINKDNNTSLINLIYNSYSPILNKNTSFVYNIPTLNNSVITSEEINLLRTELTLENEYVNQIFNNFLNDFSQLLIDKTQKDNLDILANNIVESLIEGKEINSREILSNINDVISQKVVTVNNDGKILKKTKN